MSTDDESSIETTSTQSDTSSTSTGKGKGKGKGKTLEDWIVYNLLVEAENSSAPRDDFDLLQLCDEKPDIFGKKKGGLQGRRRLVQKKWERTKRRPIASYVHYLKQKKVQPSACTLKLLAKSTAPPAANVPDVSVTPSEESVTPSEDSDEDTISEFLSNLSISGDSFLKRGNSNISNPSPSPLLTPPRPARMEDFPVSTGTPSWSAESVGAGRELPLVHGTGRGTKFDPIVIIVDKNIPESHRGFHVHYLPNIAHEGYSRKGWKVWRSAYWRDKKFWSMMTYQSTNVDLANRSVMVKGPSRPCWAAMDAAWQEKMDCAATSDQCAATTLAIKEDESRQFTYWLIIFPQDTHLDNVILSGDPFKVKGKLKGIMEDIEGVEHRYHTMNWKIADRNGGVNVSIAVDESSEDDCD
jgi:hypothetical protein